MTSALIHGVQALVLQRDGPQPGQRVLGGDAVDHREAADDQPGPRNHLGVPRHPVAVRLMQGLRRLGYSNFRQPFPMYWTSSAHAHWMLSGAYHSMSCPIHVFRPILRRDQGHGTEQGRRSRLLRAGRHHARARRRGFDSAGAVQPRPGWFVCSSLVCTCSRFESGRRAVVQHNSGSG